VTWLTWRQFRTPSVAAASALGLLAVVLAITGPQAAHLYDTTVATCQAHHDCSVVINAFQSYDAPLQTVIKLAMLVVPAVIGLFWGAPLIAREIEAGTHRLAWTQSVTRTRWLAVKLGLAGLVSMAAAGLLSLMVTWWSSPFDRVGDNWILPTVFSQRGIVPVGYAAFAFMLGVVVGLLARRTLPAMAITLAVFVAVQVAVPLWVRPHLIAPVRTSSALNFNNVTSLGTRQPGNTLSVGIAPQLSGSWIYSSEVTTAAGRSDLGAPPAACGVNSTFSQCKSAVSVLHLRQVVTYQPASRFWAFQWYETGLYLAAALVLAAFCVWRVRRRLS
jgi:ABC-type transport system involved in multi-copper enzyme maturation permease subunit